MMRSLRLLTLAALVAVPASYAQARPVRTVVKAPPNPALKAREAAMKGFTARMNRLDALMGTGAGRSRSASAEP
jgi:hypothetical protein